MCDVDYYFALIPTLRFSFAFEGVGNFGKVVVLVQGSSTVLIYDSVPLLEVLCEGLEAVAGHNMLEALSFEIRLPGGFYMDPDFMGSTIQTVENVLFKPGWSALRQVSFKLPVELSRSCEKLSEELQFLPDKYLSRLLKLESVAFRFSAYVERI